MKITITLREAKDTLDWDRFCDVVGLNPWCFSEGLAEGTEEYTLTVEQAKACGVLND